jgi:hypothetical protein
MKTIAPLALVLLVVVLLLGTAPVHAACGESKASPACGTTPSALFDSQGRLWVVFVDEIFVAWTRQNSATYSGDIRFARSVDDGRHFPAVTTINDDGLPTSHRFVALAVSPSGTLYLAWLDKRDQIAPQAAGATYAGAALYYTLSTDGGSTFVRNRKVADHSCECCRLALAPAGAEDMQVLWRHVFDEGRVRDHAIATLAPETASAPTRATDDQWLIDGCPHHGASFYSLNERLNVNAFYRISQDSFDQSGANLVALDDFSVLDLSATWQVTDNIQVYGRLENVLDEDYQEILTYNTPGRAGYIGFKLSFEGF